MMIGTTLNSIIRADGNPKFAMTSMLAGAILNIILDPVFIFAFNMGVEGAAIATVISQFLTFILNIFYIRKFKSIKLSKEDFKFKFNLASKVSMLGISSFITQMAIVVVMAVENNLLGKYGAESEFGSEIPITVLGIVMKISQILNSIIIGIAAGAQPILGYNYGAQKYDRVLQGIKFVTIAALSMMLILWVAITIFPEIFIRIFSNNQEVIVDGMRALRLYFFGFFMMSFQMTGQAVAVGLGKSKQAIFFSIFRKVIIVAPLTIILPMFIGIDGVFIAEAISNFIGGGACYITMWLTIGKSLKHKTE